jgi:hypothetical protein
MGDALVALYGDSLTALVPQRDAMRVDVNRVVVGSKVRIAASTARDDVLQAYVDVLAAVRGAKQGAAVALRTADLEELASTLGRDVDDIETRIAELLQCTRAEAATVHAELRRRMLVPAAGLAVGAAAWAGAITAAPGTAASTSPQSRPVVRTEAVAAPTPVTSDSTTPSTVAPTTSTTTAPTPSTTVATPTTVAPATMPTTAATPTTTPPATTPPVTAAATTTSAPVDDPPVSIPPGETPTIVQP